jgi:TetR/AcrR family transcriptional regulator
MALTSEMSAGQLRILKAVATLLENPANRITVQKIAEAIHVTDGAIYRHYASKDEIFEAIASYMEANLLGPLNAAGKVTENHAKRLELVFDQHLAFLEGHPGLARLMLGGGSTEAAPMAERLKMLNAKVRAQVAQLFKMAEAQGVVLPDVTAEAAMELYFGLMVGSAVSFSFSLPQVGTAAKWQLLAKSTLKGGTEAVLTPQS